MVSKPKAPSPWDTAAAQTASNRETAVTQHELNMVDQRGPWGSVTYDQTGTSASGTPLYTQTTNLSPSQQRIFEQAQAAEGNLASIAADRSKFLQGYLGKQIDLSGLPELQTSYAGADDFSADRQRVEDALWDRMAGDRSQADAAMRSTLAAKGVREGSAAWDAEMQRMAAQNTDARLATIAAGGAEQSRLVGLARDAATFNNASRTQGMSEAFAERSAPLNEITALLSGSQVQAPGLMSSATPQTGVANTNIAGLIQNDYENRMGQYQTGMNSLGGLFGLAMKPFGGLFG